MDETCKKCDKRAFFEGLCKNHFHDYFIRKLRKEVRKEGLVKPHGTFIAPDTLCQEAFKEVVQGLPHELKEEGEGKRLWLWTMDDEIESFLDAFFSNRELPPLGHGDGIKIFLPVRDKEVEAYARLKCIGWQAPDREAVGQMVEEMAGQHPETRYAISANLQELGKILQERKEKA